MATLIKRSVEGQVQELDLYAWNTGELYQARLDVVRGMLATPSDKAAHVNAWRAWFARAADQYRREFPEERVLITYEAIKQAAEERCESEARAIEIGEYDFLRSKQHDG